MMGEKEKEDDEEDYEVENDRMRYLVGVFILFKILAFGNDHYYFNSDGDSDNSCYKNVLEDSNNSVAFRLMKIVVVRFVVSVLECGVISYVLFVASFGINSKYNPNNARNGSISLWKKIFGDRMVLHNIGGLGTCIFGLLLITFHIISNNSLFLWLWYAFVILNTASGLVMIARIPVFDIGAKRLFIISFLSQLFWICFGLFVTFSYHLQPFTNDESSSFYRHLTTFAILVVILSFINFFIFLIDYLQGRSSTIMSVSKFRQKGNNNTNEDSSLYSKFSIYDHYLAVLFKRGATETRAPAYLGLVFVSFIIFIPLFIALLFLINIQKTLPFFHQSSASSCSHDESLTNYLIYLSYLVVVVGNAQVFHASLVLIGKEPQIQKAIKLVVISTLCELILILFNLFASFQLDLGETIHFLKVMLLSNIY